MATCTIEELAATLQPGQAIAGLDLGTKTIGLAMSDLGRRFASPRPVIKRVKFTKDAEVLLAFAAREKVAGFIIGLPMNMDGSAGPRVQATRAFVRTMGEKTDIPFVFWDERLSTVAAERALLEMDVSRAKRAERIDSAAASFILQGALDRLSLLASDATERTDWLSDGRAD
ncbi:Holliday junction resolvase RuvX [Rhizobium sp. SSA_523]|uniref:Holliday junction resolvase RuvX n=1 Tax=Rhizobium sp. SSA_523 TaxID=2952477 RepID=UPI002090552B|nr:Holliday junction resolvase RuvX [Rhizobium sp. SSA_523]MCO5730606.1 Holliday junction resolvase RuvX [Rhizobium sp. SSA_523]WKC24563.1 Holliday junction resolvase RuvX [Rhizobium sp. SSA_523]